MIQGSCGCGVVRFELTAPPQMMGTCHCGRCRKFGSSTFVIVRRDTFRWLQGQDRVARHEPALPFRFTRCFCSVCGTSLGEPFADAETFPIVANCLDDDPGVRNRFHEWVSAKPPWYDICDGARQFAEDPAGG